MNCGALILAAGASTRLGSPKQLARLGDETLLDRAVRTAVEAGCAPVAVVLGANEEIIRSECHLQDCIVVSNPAWSAGMGTSLACGVQALASIHAILVMTCDMPSVCADHLLALAASGELTASSYAGRNGTPAYFPKDLFPLLMELSGDEGARELLQSAPGIELPGGALDIDTAEDLARAQEALK